MERTCGACGVCCDRPEVRGHGGFYKPAHTKCPHLEGRDSDRCAIFGKAERPEVCGAFRCSWLLGAGAEDDRPDKCGVMFSTNTMNGGHWVFAVEDKKDALTTTGRNMALFMARNHDVPVIVLDHASRPPGDYGDRVVVKESLKSKTKKMRGKLLGLLDDRPAFEIYELVGKD